MAWTQADLDNLERAVASGARSIQYGDRRVDLRRLEEVNAIRAEMRRDLTGGVDKKYLGKWVSGL